MGIRLDRAELLAIILESFAFGIFTVLCVLTLWVLITKPMNGRANKISMFVLLSLYALAGAHWIIDILRSLEAYVDAAGTPYGALAFFHHTAETKHVVKTAIYSTETIVGDTYVIYRTWIVWERKWRVIIFPIILLVATGFTGYGIAYSIANIHPGGTIFALQAWITSCLVLSVCTNSLCTGLIAYRVWKSMTSVKRSSSTTPSQLFPFVMVIVESGALYCVAVFVALVVFLCGSNGQFPAIDLLPPITGITFTLIIVRVSLTSKIGATFSGQGTTGSSKAHQRQSYPTFAAQWTARRGADLEAGGPGIESGNRFAMTAVSTESAIQFGSEYYHGDRYDLERKSTVKSLEATPWASSGEVSERPVKEAQFGRAF